MGSSRSLRIHGVVALLLCAAVADAECVSQVRETSSGVFNRTATAVAWTGTVLGVTKVDESGSRAIQFATYSEDLVPFTFDRRIADSSFLGVVALQWTGSEFAVFYLDTSRQLSMQRVSASGEPIGGASAIAPNHPALIDREYDVAWDATRQAFLIVTSIISGLDRGLWLITVNRDGTVRSDEVITTTVVPPAFPRIAVNKAGVFAVLFRRSGLFSVRVYDASGVGGQIQPVMTAREARIAAGGSTFAIAGNTPAGAPTEIDWTVVDDHGNLVAPSSRLFSARGVEIAPASLLWNESRNEWALAYLDSAFPFSQVAPDYRLRRFTASSTLISDSMFSIDGPLTRLATAQPFVWTGASYVSAASRNASSTGTPESYLIHLCPLTATISALQFFRPGQNVTFTASVDGGASDQTFTWNFGDSGKNETGPSITRRYERLGDYTIVLRVTDSTGATSLAKLEVHVIVSKRRAVKR
jgi:hypothetical protein